MCPVAGRGNTVPHKTYSYLCHLNKYFKNIGLLILLTLYCFVISIYSGIAVGNTGNFSKQCPSRQQAYSKVVSEGSFCHTAQSEISGAVCNAAAAAPVPLKNTHDEIIAGFKAAEQLFLHRFSQYSFFSKNLLIRLQKTALIFPFHYFW